MSDFVQNFKSETKTYDVGDEYDPEYISKFNLIIPWRLCFAGGWMDLEWCNKYYPGPVITINVKYNTNFKDRCGLATSTRKHWIKVFNGEVPSYLTDEDFAKTLWGSENMESLSYIKKGKYLAGSQDHVGLAFPGINYLYYDGGFWPKRIDTINDICNDKHKAIFKWLEEVLYLVEIKKNCRPPGYNSQKINYLKDPNINIEKKKEMVKNLANASQLCWDGINEMNIDKVGKGLTGTMLGWKAILPATVPDELDSFWKEYNKLHKGCLFSGAGGGFLFVISDKPVKNGFKIKINNDPYFRTKTIKYSKIIPSIKSPKLSDNNTNNNNNDESKADIKIKTINDDDIPYNKPSLVDMYKHFHYCNETYFGVGNFSKIVADIAIAHTKPDKRINVMDVGCAVGRTCFELSKSFNNIIGIDYAKELIKVGNEFKNKGKLSWKIKNHGDIYDEYTCNWNDININKTNTDKVKFFVGDAHNLLNNNEYSNIKYNCLIACNLIDRLSKPIRFLTKIKRLLIKNSILIIVDPYTWMNEYTNKNDWIGGKIIDGYKLNTFDELTTILNNQSFKLIKEMDIEMVIRETKRKYQHTLSHCSIWELI